MKLKVGMSVLIDAKDRQNKIPPLVIEKSSKHVVMNRVVNACHRG